VMSSPKLKNRWVNLLNQGHPVVLVGVCEDSDMITAWLEKNKLDGAGFFVLGTEVLNPSRGQGSTVAGLVSPIEAYFDKKRTTIWTSKIAYPAEFPLEYTVKTLEE